VTLEGHVGLNLIRLATFALLWPASLPAWAADSAANQQIWLRCTLVSSINPLPQIHYILVDKQNMLIAQFDENGDNGIPLGSLRISSHAYGSFSQTPSESMYVTLDRETGEFHIAVVSHQAFAMGGHCDPSGPPVSQAKPKF